MSLPNILKHNVSQFPTLRKRVRLTISSGSDAVASNGILRVKLPDRSLVDLSTLAITATGAITGTDAAGCAFPPTYGLIRRLGATIGGVNVGYSNNNYGQVAHACALAQVGQDFDDGNCLGSYNPANPQQNGAHLQFNYFPNSVMTMGILDTMVYGSAELDIQFEGDNAIVKGVSTATDIAWSLSAIRCYVDVLELQDEAYMVAVQSHLQNGGSYKKALTMATSVVQTGTSSNQFNVSTQSLDKVLVGVKDSAFETEGVRPSESLYGKYLDFKAQGTSSVYIQINSQSLPQYGHSDRFQDLAQITRANYGDSVYNFNKLFVYNNGGDATIANTAIDYKADAYLNNNAVCFFKTGAEGPASMNGGRMTGLDLSGGNSIIRVETENLPANAKLLMAGVHSSTLEGQSGQVVAYRN